MGDLKCREVKIGFWRKRCKSVILRLAKAGNLEKPLMSLYGTEWREHDAYAIHTVGSVIRVAAKIKVAALLTSILQYLKIKIRFFFLL